ncbi:MAG: hypothetical protein EOO06_01015 [Chitinophagaceae bacterium]|nr:MAG: hypothetical protein EOO06_01015 [Chitinophagaceae bacterium]
MALIENVTFLFAKVQNPVPSFNKVDSEWTVDVVCSKADAKKVKKEFPKTSLKEFDNADFTEKFGIEPPFPSQDEQFILKFKKSHIKNGQETPEKYRPRVIQELEDGSREDITFDKLIGNGSKGTMSYRVKETKDYGNFVELQALLITDLVEYKSKAGGVTDDFGPVKLAEAPVQERVAVKQGGATVTQAEPEDELDDSALPF